MPARQYDRANRCKTRCAGETFERRSFGRDAAAPAVSERRAERPDSCQVVQGRSVYACQGCERSVPKLR